MYLALVPSQVKILGKCEFANPSGSIKDRIADHILTTAENEGKLKPGGTVVAATSGNTGASVAMIAAMKGYHYIGMVLANVHHLKTINLLIFMHKSCHHVSLHVFKNLFLFAAVITNEKTSKEKCDAMVRFT